MKKVIILALAAAAFTASAFAGTSTSGISVGVGAATIKDKSDSTKFTGTGMDIAYSINTVYENNIVFGYDVHFNRVSMDLGENGKTPIYSLGTDLKLGYSPIPKLIGYGIVGADYQAIKYTDDPANGGGFSYGAGAEYQILSHMAANVEYKTGSTKAVGDVRDLKYTYSTTQFNLKYTF
jgi:opacity protein-like surface antigen